MVLFGVYFDDIMKLVFVFFTRFSLHFRIICVNRTINSIVFRFSVLVSILMVLSMVALQCLSGGWSLTGELMYCGSVRIRRRRIACVYIYKGGT